MTTIRPVVDVADVDVIRVTELRPDGEPASRRRPGPRPRTRPAVTCGYTPGFDGLRALGLLVILAYHHGVDAARGGIFTLSMFFTLSGYLIATLTLAEWSQHGRISMGRFWERRARRLLPAAFVTAAAVVLLQRWWGIGAGDTFRIDLLAALGYVANWRFASSGGDYAGIFAAERPVQHFWSLAVEEQFYFLFPLCFVGLMAVTRGRWRVVGLAFGLLSAASFVAAWRTASSRGNSELAYYATHTRASEILAGVALAFLVVAEPVRRFVASPAGVRAVRWGGVVGLAGYAWLWHSVGLSSPLVFRGGTLLNAGLTSLLILAATSASPGRIAGFLGIWPLRSLGKVSYAVYLFHWPLFLLLDGERTGLGHLPLFVVRVAATVGLAVVSYHVVEAPFRFGFKGLSGVRLVAVLAVPAVAVVGLVRVVDVRSDGVIDLSTAAADRDGNPLARDVVDPFMVAEPVPPTKLLLVGDSISWTMWWGMGTWNAHHPDRLVSVDSLTAMGCPIGSPGVIRHLGTVVEDVGGACWHFRDSLREALAATDYDAVVVAQGGADLADRRIHGRWRHLGQRPFDDWFRSDLAAFADILATERVPVLWAALPHMRARSFEDPTVDWRDHPDNDPERVDRLNQLFDEVVFVRPGFVRLDVGRWLRSQPGGEFDDAVRGDGAHYSERGSDQLAEWMVPQVLAAVEGAAAPTG